MTAPKKPNKPFPTGPKDGQPRPLNPKPPKK